MDADTLIALVNSATSDAATKERLAEMTARQNDLDARSRQLDEQAMANAQVLADARKERQAAEAIKGEVEKRKADLDDFEGRLREVSEGLNREKAAWEAVRQRVDREQADRKSALDERDAALSQAADQLAERKKSLDGREVAIKQMEMAHARQEEAARAFLAARG